MATDSKGSRSISRRRAINTVAAGGLVLGAAPFIVTRSAAAAKTLKILQWNHFVPAFDTWFNGQYVKEWGKKNDTEVIVDHTTGQVAKAEPITDAKDLAAATAQRAAMTRAKQSLQTIVDAAVKAHAGMRAVSVFPALKGEKAVAEITLSKNGAFMTVSEPLE